MQVVTVMPTNAFNPGRSMLSIYWLADRVGPTAGLDVVEKTKISDTPEIKPNL
jgi:hypothetical protein